MSPEQPDTSPPEEKAGVEADTEVEEDEKYQGGEIPRVDPPPEESKA